MNAEEIIKHLGAKKIPADFRVGDTVKVHVKIQEGDKERIQVFEGTVIKSRRGGPHSTFTVRKISYGTGVERIFPFASQVIDRVEVISRGRVRRAKLFYLRQRTGKDILIDKAQAPTNEVSSTETPAA